MRIGLAVLAAAAAAAIVAESSSGAAAPHLAYSTASNNVVQRQPAPGTCHAIGSGLRSRPDPRCTPGALNPAVTQATIAQTICRSGWTDTVRPSESITEPEKIASLQAYGDRGPVSSYEYDHFVPLELGGATNDPRNLWPEPGASPNAKDGVEGMLNSEVCNGQMTLAHAQDAIVGNWVALLHSRSPSSAGATCSASAQYSATYHDYDVYVHSNQPDTTVTVTGAGTTATWHTDSSGYADVYFKAGPSASGETVTVRVGAATCTARL